MAHEIATCLTLKSHLKGIRNNKSCNYQSNVLGFTLIKNVKDFTIIKLHNFYIDVYLRCKPKPKFLYN